MNTLISQRPLRRGFTLIEMLVVIAIIAILMGAVVAVGTSVRAQANRRTTLAELKVLEGLMDEYLAAGGVEPQVPVVASSANGWYYGLSTAPSNYGSNETYYRTNPGSDPYNWVIALQSNPDTAKKLANLQSRPDSDTTYMTTTQVVHTLIIDSYGNHIRYVPSTTTKKGYFVSAGPDGKWSNALLNNGGSTALHSATQAIRADEIYSYDPQ